MRRREVIGLLGGAVAMPLAAHAQQAERMRHIAILMGLAESDPETIKRLARFKKDIEKLGWSEGRNLRIEVRFAPGGARAAELAKELIAQQPEVILTHSAQVAGALFRTTRTIPVVFVNVSDPIGAGFIVSLAQPGGNFTGILHYEPGILGKWLAMLKEIAPNVTRAALVGDPKSPVYDYFVRAAQAAGRSLAITLVPAPVESAADIERSISSFCRHFERQPGIAARRDDHHPSRSYSHACDQAQAACGLSISSFCGVGRSDVLRNRSNRNVRANGLICLTASCAV